MTSFILNRCDSTRRGVRNSSYVHLCTHVYWSYPSQMMHGVRNHNPAIFNFATTVIIAAL